MLACHDGNLFSMDSKVPLQSTPQCMGQHSKHTKVDGGPCSLLVELPNPTQSGFVIQGVIRLGPPQSLLLLGGQLPLLRLFLLLCSKLFSPLLVITCQELFCCLTPTVQTLHVPIIMLMTSLLGW